MTSNTHESVARAARYQQHVDKLCAVHGIRADVDPALDVARARAYPQEGRIIIAPIRCEVGYAVALHELGHLVAAGGSVPMSRFSLVSQITARDLLTESDHELLLSEEHAAWAWARTQALEWTPLMEWIQQKSVGSYEQHVPLPPHVAKLLGEMAEKTLKNLGFPA